MAKTGENEERTCVFSAIGPRFRLLGNGKEKRAIGPVGCTPHVRNFFVGNV